MIKKLLAAVRSSKAIKQPSFSLLKLGKHAPKVEEIKEFSQELSPSSQVKSLSLLSPQLISMRVCSWVKEDSDYFSAEAAELSLGIDRNDKVTANELLERMSDKTSPPILFFASSNKSKIGSLSTSLKLLGERAPSVLIFKEINREFSPEEPYSSRSENARNKALESIKELERFVLKHSLRYDPKLNSFSCLLAALYDLDDFLKYKIAIKDFKEFDFESLAIREQLSLNSLNSKILSPELQAKILVRFFGGSSIKSVYSSIQKSLDALSLSEKSGISLHSRLSNIISALIVLNKDLYAKGSELMRVKNQLKSAMEKNFLMTDDSTLEIEALGKFDHDPIKAARLIKDTSQRPVLKIRLTKIKEEIDELENDLKRGVLHFDDNDSNEIYQSKKNRLDKLKAERHAVIYAILTLIKSDSPNTKKVYDSEHLKFLVEELDRRTRKYLPEILHLMKWKMINSLGFDIKVDDVSSFVKNGSLKEKPVVWVQDFEDYVDKAEDDFKVFFKKFEVYLYERLPDQYLKLMSNDMKLKIEKVILELRQRVRWLAYTIHKASLPANAQIYPLGDSTKQLVTEAEADYEGYITGMDSLGEILASDDNLNQIEQIFIPLSQKASLAKSSFDLDEASNDRGVNSQSAAYNKILQRLF